MRSLDIAATGMQAQQLYVDVTSQNLANINTTAYKLQRPEFQDLLYQNARRVGTNSADTGTIVPTGVQIGLGVRTAAIYRNTGQGTLQNTENPLDLAIQGKGYFQINQPDGTIAYTRAGTFQLSPTGTIVTTDGFEVQPAITVPTNATSVSVNQSGEVFATIPGQTAPQNLGQLQTTNFVNEAGLQAIGQNLYLETAASGTPTTGTPGVDGFGTIIQGFLETSNVNPVSELTNLIRAQRVYELNSRVISKTDEMLQALTQSV
ncbi:MAG: flagellar basal-body rod protein FlgG [Rickettsiales bacterium]|jgi:flagellar basal-body rod protein FlgG|nr:flagellar basal-body rod protein FlgG [Rickettsiales bacterium]